MKIAIIGAGNMGGATVWGLYKSKFAAPADLHVCDLSEEKLKPFAEAGMSTSVSSLSVIEGAELVAVFVKPWIVEKVLEEIKPALDYAHQTLVIVAAGVKGSDLKSWLDKSGLPDAVEQVADKFKNIRNKFEKSPKKNELHPNMPEAPRLPQLFLAIPNIAISELSSMTFLTPVNASASSTEQVKAMFDAMGQTLVVEERLLSAGTTLASCGLAYAMRYVRAAAEGGVELGFYPNMARDIVLQTVEGAVRLLQAGGEHPEAAIDKVTTPGGVTIKGLNEMEHAGFTSAVIRGLKAGM